MAILPLSRYSADMGRRFAAPDSQGASAAPANSGSDNTTVPMVPQSQPSQAGSIPSSAPSPAPVALPAGCMTADSFITKLQNIIFGKPDSDNTDNLFDDDLISLLGVHNSLKTYERSLHDKGYTPTRSSSMTFNTSTNLSALNNTYNRELSQRLAHVAYDTAVDLRQSGGCAYGVGKSIRDANIAGNEVRDDAYKMADKLANNPNFRQVQVSREDLKKLPAGCIVIFDKGEGHKWGHATITLGDNKSACDHYEPDFAEVVKNHPQNFAVFVPVAAKA